MFPAPFTGTHLELATGNLGGAEGQVMITLYNTEGKAGVPGCPWSLAHRSSVVVGDPGLHFSLFWFLFFFF